MIEEISVKDLGEIKEKYQIIDIRDEIDFRYGTIPGAVNIPLKEIGNAAKAFDADTFYVIMCKSGIISAGAAEELRDAGLRAANLK